MKENGIKYNWCQKTVFPCLRNQEDIMAPENSESMVVLKNKFWFQCKPGNMESLLKSINMRLLGRGSFLKCPKKYVEEIFCT